MTHLAAPGNWLLWRRTREGVHSGAMAENNEGKGLVAGGGILAVLASAFAHGADDCARLGAQGARLGSEAAVGAQAARLGSEAAIGAQAARVGSEAAVGAQGAKTLGNAGVKTGLQGGSRVGARGLSGVAPRGVAVAAGDDVGRIGARLSAAEEHVLQEIPGYAIDAIDLFRDDDPPLARLPPRPFLQKRASYLPLHADFTLSWADLRPGVEALPPPPPGSSEAAILGSIRATMTSPVIISAWLGADSALAVGGTSIPMATLFERCHRETVACFVVACAHDALRSCNQRMSEVWQTTLDAMPREAVGSLENLGVGLLQARGRLDADRSITVARSDLSSGGRPFFLVSTPASPSSPGAASAAPAPSAPGKPAARKPNK